MNAIGDVFQAEFKVRSRRFSFIAMIALALFAAFWFVPRDDSSLQVMVIQPDRFLQAGNPSWIPIASAWGLGFFLPLAGFFYLKNLISQDKQLGLAPFVNTSPLSRVWYITGKWLAGIALLYGITAVVMIGSFVMMLLHFPGQWLSAYDFLSPYVYLLVVIPFFLAVAIFFDSIRFMRGVSGSIAFIVGFIALYVVVALNDMVPLWVRFIDLSGSTMIIDTIKQAVLEQSGQPMDIMLFLGGGDLGNVSPTRELVFHGTRFMAEDVIGLTGMLALSLGLVALSAPMTALSARSEEVQLPKPGKAKASKTIARNPNARYHPIPDKSAPVGAWLLTLKGEIILLLAGQAPLWWLVTAGGIVACVFAPLDTTQSILLPLLMVWLINVFSALGSREHRYDFIKIIAISPCGTLRQAVATWVSGVLMALIVVSPVVARLLLAGNATGATACFAGAVFLPSLALFLGEVTRVRRVFEIVLIILSYIALNGVSVAMMFGDPTNVSTAMATLYLVLGLGLGAAAVTKRMITFLIR